ncbi:MAG: BBP7 family outer membrane beta-barrel protein [Anaerolineae bacterium]
MDAEYLYWKIKDSPAPVALVTKGSTFAPVLGSSGSSLILGRKRIDNKWRSGGKFALGYWFDKTTCYGIEASYFFLPNQSKHESASTTGLPGSPNLGVPFVDVIDNMESSYGLSNTGAYSGLGSFRVRNRMQGAELNGLLVLRNQHLYKIDLLLGFRYWNFNERATFFTDSPFISLPNDIFNSTDKFKANNNFYGGQIGFGFDYSPNCFFINVKGKIALGADCGRVNIHGYFRTNEFNPIFAEGAPQTIKGGIYALPTNIGSHDRTFFCAIPEVNVNTGCQILKFLKLQVGYTFIYVSKVLWATSQIDRKLNPTQSPTLEDTSTPVLVGKASPRPLHKTHSLWVQGLNAGVTFTF